MKNPKHKVTPTKEKSYPTLSFKENAKLGMELQSKQKPVTLKEARAQVKWLKSVSVTKTRKKK